MSLDTSLKTLKEIFEMPTCGDKQTDLEVVYQERIKAEAIKWYKHYEKINKKHNKITAKVISKNNKEEFEKRLSYDLDLAITMDFVKRFFNITKEDLK